MFVAAPLARVCYPGQDLKPPLFKQVLALAISRIAFEATRFSMMTNVYAKRTPPLPVNRWIITNTFGILMTLSLSSITWRYSTTVFSLLLQILTYRKTFAKC